MTSNIHPLLQVNFPSGRFFRVDVEYWGLSVTLQSIGADFERMVGLCGNFDGKPFNDFRKLDADDVDVVDDDYVASGGISDKKIVEFVEHWR